MTTIELSKPLLEASSANTDSSLIRRLFSRWRERRHERATLTDLSLMPPHLLQDMGIEPGDIYDALDGRRSSKLLKRMRKPGHLSR